MVSSMVTAEHSGMISHMRQSAQSMLHPSEVSFNNSKQVLREVAQAAETSPDEYATEVHGEKQRDSGKYSCKV